MFLLLIIGGGQIEGCQSESGRYFQTFLPKGSHYTKFKPVKDKFSETRTREIVTLLHCITGMTQYDHKSLEELRLEDYRYMGRTMDTKPTALQQQMSTIGLEGHHEIRGRKRGTMKHERIQTLKSELQQMTVRAEQAEGKIIELLRRLNVRL